MTNTQFGIGLYIEKYYHLLRFEIFADAKFYLVKGQSPKLISSHFWAVKLFLRSSFVFRRN